MMNLDLDEGDELSGCHGVLSFLVSLLIVAEVFTQEVDDVLLCVVEKLQIVLSRRVVHVDVCCGLDDGKRQLCEPLNQL